MRFQIFPIPLVFRSPDHQITRSPTAVAASSPVRYYGTLMKVISHTALLILTACLLFLNGCGKPAYVAHPVGPQGFPVKVQVAQAQMVPESTEYLATGEARNTSRLHPPGEGEVNRLL